ncbi:MAG: hypothetical protein H6729_02655 [Deltaproteobacteria bacterium]|nr:hypothetical protein [Deltaproteobacteria bacterium]
MAARRSASGECARLSAVACWRVSEGHGSAGAALARRRFVWDLALATGHNSALVRTRFELGR